MTTPAQREAVARVLDEGHMRLFDQVSSSSRRDELADEIIAAYEAAAPKRWDCKICGGVVDLSNPIGPTAYVGPGRHSSQLKDPAHD